MAPHRSVVFILGMVAACGPSDHPTVERPNVERILSDDRYEWVTVETENTRIHFPVGSHAQRNKDVLAARAEESRRSVLSRLSESSYGEPLDLFYVDGREDMANLTGSPVAGFSYHEDRAIVIVFNDLWRGFERHELAHVVSLERWPTPAGPAVVEGLATYVDGDCGRYENGRIVRTLLDMGALIPLDTLAADFRRHDDLIAYLQAASTIEFMVLRQNPGVIARLWDAGLRAAPGLLQLSTDSFRAEFESWLSSNYDPIPTEVWHAIRAGGCGIDARPDTNGSQDRPSH